MADATDFTANGPTTVGFRTGGDGTGIDNGVVVSGKICGVHGTGTGTVNSSDEVCGVLGESSVGFGVKGLSHGGFPGVRGIGTGSIGVHGSSGTDTGVFGLSTDGLGVKGESTTNDGVVGVSSGRRKSGVFGDNTRKDGDAFGVSGRTASPQGAGINGFSDTGYGGHFRGGRAPLRLQPAAASGHPTTGNHQRGELYVDGKGVLFFCKDDGTPGTWFRVQLTPA